MLFEVVVTSCSIITFGCTMLILIWENGEFNLKPTTPPKEKKIR